MIVCDCCKNAGKICATTGMECSGGLELCANHTEQLNDAITLVQSLFRSKPPGYVPNDQEAKSWAARIVPR